jgi:ribonuclease E
MLPFSKPTTCSSWPRRLLGTAATLIGLLVAAPANAQVVYYSTLRPVVVASPVVAAPMVTTPVIAAPTYVANYTPAGNYAAVTAFSPPVMAPTAGVAVTSYYAPSYASAYAPAATVAYYAPAPVAAAPVVAAPVTAYYAPAPVVGQLYRRGPLGVYRPVRSAYMIGY